MFHEVVPVLIVILFDSIPTADSILITTTITITIVIVLVWTFVLVLVILILQSFLVQMMQACTNRKLGC